MASREEILEQITDISVTVLACDPDDITPRARFSELGSDSLTIVEIGEELGRRFDVYLSDDSIDSMRTVEDAIDAVVDLTAAAAAAPAVRAPKPAQDKPTTPARSVATTTAIMPAATSAPVERAGFDPHQHGPHFKAKALGLVTWMAIIGVLVGGVIGFGTSAVVSASGISDVSLPPINATTATPTPTASTPTPTPKPSPTNAADPEPTLEAAKSQVSPGERFVLSGVFPAVGEGADLQVQVREPGTDWDDFPITTQTREDGQFKTELYTSRTGEREFRLLDEESGDTTPTVKVQIG